MAFLKKKKKKKKKKKSLGVSGGDLVKGGMLFHILT